jgi:UDP-N-acetylglucosamine 2-epimerase (non-hydrolysing)
VAAGTRSELLKLAPVVAALDHRGATVEVIRTGRPADARLAREGLGSDVAGVHARWTPSGDDPAQTAGILEHAMRHLTASPPDLVVIQGDSTSAALVAVAARRAGLAVAHVEAGLRSGEPQSQGELHRRMIASLATIHLAPTAGAAANLTTEGVPLHRIHVVGNPICDALVDADVERVPVADRRGILFTAHRVANVDHFDRLEAVVEIARRLALLAPVTFPLHPRTAVRLVETELIERLEAASVVLTEPMTHRELLRTMAGSRLVVTDSGGLQEEASWFGVPVVVLRTSTPRPEGVEVGQAVLVGLDVHHAVDAARHLFTDERQEAIEALPCPYGDGRASPRIAEILFTRWREGALEVDQRHSSLQVAR